MTYTELFLLALGLCFDTFAISLTGGICSKTKFSFLQICKIFFSFAFFQCGFCLLGWALGVSFLYYIETFDHWIAFVLLVFIGGKMVIESLHKNNNAGAVNLLDTKKLIFLSVATSIDALAVGISLAMLSLSSIKVWMVMTSVFVVTSFASLSGLLGGKLVGNKFGNRSEMVGGLILIAIGVKILVEHLAL